MSNTESLKVWIYWHTGIDTAPEIVKACIRSWEIKNPDASVIVLDKDSIDEYIDVSWALDRLGKDITLQAFSDILRINLLASQGGIWADATLFSCKPVYEWFDPSLNPIQFLMRPNKKHAIASYFIYAKKGSAEVELYKDTVNDYFQSQIFRYTPSSKVGKVLNRLTFGTNYFRFWFSFPIRKLLKVYPYFWFHYLYETIEEQLGTGELMAKYPREFSAQLAMKVQRELGLEVPCSPDLCKKYCKQCNVIKLDWRSKPIKGSFVEYLLVDL